MNKIEPLSNSRHNVTQLIKNIHKIKPDATNHEIKEVLLEHHGLECGSNLIIQAIGSERDRLPLMQRRDKLIPKAMELLEVCNGNTVVAHNVLNHVVKNV